MSSNGLTSWQIERITEALCSAGVDLSMQASAAERLAALRVALVSEIQAVNRVLDEPEDKRSNG